MAYCHWEDALVKKKATYRSRLRIGECSPLHSMRGHAGRPAVAFGHPGERIAGDEQPQPGKEGDDQRAEPL